MRRAVRENALCALLAGTGCATMAWLGLYGFAWNDYDTEARPSFEALLHGHLLEFLRLVPAYGGSLIERAPFAFLPSLWGGGELAVYRMVALPCLLASAVLSVWLLARMRSRGRPVWWRAVALGVCVANPITLRALELGHAEELLGASLCVAAVLLSSRDRPVWAGALLGLAIANKEWALLLTGPVLLAMPERPGESRARQMILCLATAGVVAASLTLPILLAGSASFVAGARTVASPSTAIFQPMQVFWFLGHHSPNAEHLLGAAKADFRLAPAWIGRVSHPLVVAVAVPLTWLAWRTRAMRERSRPGGEQPAESARRLTDALLLLSLLLLLRCMLDTWDNVYYPLPFILALLAWETDALPNPPVLALAVTVLVWLNVWLSSRVSADAQAVFFLVWSLPLAASLGALLYLPSPAWKRPAGGSASSAIPHAHSAGRRCRAMRQRARENILCAFLAGVGCATMAWLGLYGFAWNDYDTEARPSFEALLHGHLTEFLRLAPAYGGSLIERAPFALLPGLWGGGALAVYRMVALPCLLASAVLGVWLLARMRSEGRSTIARAVTLGVCVANPLTLRALELGHPEELLGGCLCVAAVLIAARPSLGRSGALWAGVILGLAVANKEWALLALGPVLLALPPRRRLPCLAAAGVVGAAVLAPLALVGSGGFVAGTRNLAAAPSAIFQPWQLFWFAGHHGALVHGTFGAPKPGYRTGPAWTGTVSHPLILAVGLIIPATLWLQRRVFAARASSGLPRAGRPLLSERDALLALTLLLLLRCLLDTWDTVYYLLPFVLALLAWEVRAPSDRPPLLALSSTVLAWISFQWLPLHASADVEAAFFLAWTLPLAAVFGMRLFGPRRLETRERSWIVWSPRGQHMTVSALDSLVRTSWPSPVTTARSSIRTPRRPGR